MTEDATALPTADGMDPPGTWLAEVAPDSTLTVISLINTAIDGLGYIRNLILVGEGDDGVIRQDVARESRCDKVVDTTRTALHDLAQIQLMVSIAAERTAAAAVVAGVPLQDVSAMVAAPNAPQFMEAVHRHLGR